jgi:hypothetical protein
MERTWGNLLHSSYCFPNCLHVLTKRGGLSNAEGDGEEWVGKVMEIKKDNKENLVYFQGLIEDAIRREIGVGQRLTNEDIKRQGPPLPSLSLLCLSIQFRPLTPPPPPGDFAFSQGTRREDQFSN